MAYNLSINVVKRMRPFLEAMHQAKKDLTWPSERPDSLAYRIREAMAAAQHHEQFSKYHNLRHNYSISPQSGYVEARWMGVGGTSDLPEETFIPDRIVMEEIEDINGVVGAAIKLEARADEIYFPNVANLSIPQKRVLYDWTQGNKWVFLDQEEEGITLTRRRVEDILVWKPSDARPL